MGRFGHVSYRLAILLSMVFSPMAYLYYGHPKLAIVPTYLDGFLFIFGMLQSHRPFLLLNPWLYWNFDSFVALLMAWILTGFYLSLTALPELNRKATVWGAGLMLVVQLIAPFVLLWGYVMVVPIPAPAVIALIAHHSFRKSRDGTQED